MPPLVNDLLGPILSWFEVADKPGWTHTSDAVATIKVALQPWPSLGTRIV
jgi:hypothetical protein